MCRFLVYRGNPVYLEDLISHPSHSLIQQSRRAAESTTETNGDGFGVGWYSGRTSPGVFREVQPAWSDDNLRAVSAHLRCGLFFAHVRASSGSEVNRVNCHPFAAGRFLFMHNGQVPHFTALRRRVEAMIPDEFYGYRYGTTDSEALFLAAFGDGLEADPPSAFALVLGKIRKKMERGGCDEPLRFAAALTNGHDVWAFRWSSDDHPPSLHWLEEKRRLVIVSEPLDANLAEWRLVPANSCLFAPARESARLMPFGPNGATSQDETK